MVEDEEEVEVLEVEVEVMVVGEKVMAVNTTWSNKSAGLSGNVVSTVVA